MMEKYVTDTGLAWYWHSDDAWLSLEEEGTQLLSSAPLPSRQSGASKETQVRVRIKTGWRWSDLTPVTTGRWLRASWHSHQPWSLFIMIIIRCNAIQIFPNNLSFFLLSAMRFSFNRVTPDSPSIVSSGVWFRWLTSWDSLSPVRCDRVHNLILHWKLTFWHQALSSGCQTRGAHWRIPLICKMQNRQQLSWALIAPLPLPVARAPRINQPDALRRLFIQWWENLQNW